MAPRADLLNAMLSGAEKKRLRAAGQRLDPALGVGRSGLVDTLLVQMEFHLGRDRLVKVRFPRGISRTERDRLATELAEQTGAEWIHQVGGSGLFYRESPPTKADRATTESAG